MTKKERIRNALDGRPVDRVPFALWRYFPEEDESIDGLVEATLRYVRRWDFDLIKVMVPNRLWTMPWGGSFAAYDRDAGFYPARELLVKDPLDWKKIRAFNPRRGPFGEQIEVLRILRREAGNDIPILGTIFAPFCVGIELSGDGLHRHVAAGDRNAAQAVDTITDMLCDFAQACVEEARLDGIFYAVQSARRGALSREEYIAHSLPRDLRIFERIAGRTWFNMLHLCKTELYFDLASHFPVQAVNWHDRGKSGPSLREARRLYPGLLAGGLDHEGGGAFVSGVPAEAAAQAAEAIQQLSGQRFLLAAGCCSHLRTPEANIDAVQKVIADRAHERR